MATYHGIAKALCLTCGFVSDDESTLEMWNDYGNCPGPRHDVDEETTLWVLADGTVARIFDDYDATNEQTDLTGDDAAQAIAQVDDALKASQSSNTKVV